MISPAGRLALGMLVGDQTILNLAREVSQAIDAAGCEGGIVGGIAVFLHGYPRTTVHIDAYVTERRRVADELEKRGFHWTPERRQWEKDDFVVQLLAPEDNIGFHPSRYTELQGIRTVSLGDLISMKLCSGTKHVHRTKDLADVVELIKALKLDKGFTPHVAPEYRKDFKTLVDSLERERGTKPPFAR